MSFHKRLPPMGSRPGTLEIPPDSPAPKIHLFDYEGEFCTEIEIDDPQQLAPYVDSTRVTWVDIQGFGNAQQLHEIADLFSLHPITLEDAVNVPQRAKTEVYPEHHVIVARAPDPHCDNGVVLPQVFLLIGPHFLLTFQDHHYGFFDAVRDRIREGLGPIRQQGPDYLAYALLDTMIDHYFPRLEKCTERIEELEEAVYRDPRPEVLEDLHRVRQELVVLRRVGWPQREALRALINEPSPFISDAALPYLTSVEQHMAQAIEAVDSARETATGLVEIFLSNMSHRTNEIMKVLTLMASIFIPLTFVAGIYGMNFENMPELHNPRGYFIALAVMAVLAVGMIGYFLHRGWIGRPRKRSGGGGSGT